MLKCLTVNNIQSHEKSDLRFSPGINCIIGSSENGKSALLRAMFWAIRNRPLGNDILVSHWARNEKGKICEDVTVTIVNDRGIVTRGKTNSRNYYLIGQSANEGLRELEAVRTDVPDEVAKFFNLSETNIQQQQDAPFLLSASSADVARFFNRIVRLDIIDKVLGNAENLRRKNKAESEALDKHLQALNEKAGGYTWITDAASLLEKAERVGNRVTKLESAWGKLDGEIKQVEALSEKRTDPTLLKKAAKLLKKIRALNESLDVLRCDRAALQAAVTDHEKAQRVIDKAAPCEPAKALLSRVGTINERITPLQSARQNLNASIVSHADALYEKREAEKEAKEHWELLPDTCPICGGILEKGEVA